MIQRTETTTPDGVVTVTVWDTTARTITTTTGTAPPVVRAMTTDEAAWAEAISTDAARQANSDALVSLAAARTALGNNATFLALGSPTNAQTLAQVRALTRQTSRVIRHLLGQINPVLLDDITGT